MSVLECCPCEKSVGVKLILSLLVINQFQMAPKSRRLRGKQASVSVAKPRSRYFFLSREEKDARHVARRGQRDSEIEARNSKRKGHRTDEASKRKPRPRKLQRELELMLDEMLKFDEKMDKLKHESEAELRKKDELHERKMDELTAKHKLQLKAQPLCMAISQGKKDTQPIINSHAAEIRALNKKHLQDKQAMEAKHLDDICMERSRVKLAEERARVASECVNSSSSSSGAGQQCNDPNVKALMERRAKEKLEIHEQWANKFREERE